jgi:hypothetical protein
MTIEKLIRHFSKELRSTIKILIKYNKKATIAMGYNPKKNNITAQME